MSTEWHPSAIKEIERLKKEVKDLNEELDKFE
jgi:hypothetical protein